MNSGKKKARKVVEALKRAFTEILITVISTVIAEAIIKLIFS